MEKVKNENEVMDAEVKQIIEADELKNLQECQNQFDGYKLQLGDLEIKKTIIATEITKLRTRFSELETALINKYGKDAVINIQTGEITQKENG